MITMQKIRKVPAHVMACPVCRERLAPHGAKRARDRRRRKRSDRDQRDYACGVRTKGHRVHPRARLCAC